MSKVRRVAVLLAVGLGTMLPETAAAQRERRDTEKDDVHLRNNCRLAAQVLETGYPPPHRGWALDQILACEQTGGTALATVWRVAPVDRSALARLMYASRAMRDERVFAATAEVAEDPARPTLVRLAAMNVLTSFADSVLMARLEVLENPPPFYVLGRVLDFPITPGAEPLTGDTPERVMTLFSALATRDRDPVVVAAARYLHKGLLLHFAH
ncbi:MAG TPA: hypothetical protein VFT96_09780 [Gemmatimonadaceae bacterium]|nr:hypothetical protein [Gemmatimonadaceae bacterium]